jgi:hypothetical protein
VAALAGSDTDIAQEAEIETGELGCDAVPPGRHPLENGDAVCRGRSRLDRLRLGGGLETGELDRGVRHYATGLVDDGHLDARVALRLRRRGGEQGEDHRQQGHTPRYSQEHRDTPGCSG